MVEKELMLELLILVYSPALESGQRCFYCRSQNSRQLKVCLFSRVWLPWNSPTIPCMELASHFLHLHLSCFLNCYSPAPKVNFCWKQRRVNKALLFLISGLYRNGEGAQLPALTCFLMPLSQSRRRNSVRRFSIISLLTKMSWNLRLETS